MYKKDYRIKIITIIAILIVITAFNNLNLSIFLLTIKLVILRNLQLQKTLQP